MEKNFTISIILLGLICLVIIVLIALQDIRALRTQRRHHSIKRRSHPLVSVVVEENVSDECLASIQRNDYHHYEIVFLGERTRSKYILSLHGDTLLSPSSISNSIETLVHFPHWDHIEIKPVVPRPQNISALLRLYHLVALAPFISLRMAFNIPPCRRQLWPTLQRCNMPARHVRAKLYHFVRWLIFIMNAGLITSILVTAVSAGQPLYLLTYLFALTIWLAVCLMEYPHFSYSQKITYILLSPVSFWYFLLYAFYAPFVPIVRTVTDKIASLLWRAHHQTIA